MDIEKIKNVLENYGKVPNKDLSGVTNEVDIESPVDFHFTEFTFPPKLYFEMNLSNLLFCILHFSYV